MAGAAADPDARADLISRLRKIEGQVRGVQRMLSEDADCVDVMTQLSAVSSGVDKVALRLLREHLHERAGDAVRTKEGREERVDEIVALLERFLTSR